MTPDCDPNLTVRMAQGAATPWYCSFPGWSIWASCYPGPPVVPPAAPQTGEQMRQPGAWTPDQAVDATWAAQQQSNQEFFAQLAGRLGDPAPDCSDTMTALTTWSCGILPVVLLVGGGLLVVNLVKK
jgi:hypothetical protein